ncbi:MAG: EscU/YscU/HrcU family type III secretion system export apparatus switch protein [Candidatus Eremiobacteraeota bacterium]|nr:EscU/YscU/HrcU family type III secretion system export apparatus switch protein [Candidatus Eremiobacteraeota bacterium]
MADDKQFDPTASRMARAKREGDVARSQDLTALASLGCAAIVLFGSLGIVSAAAVRAVGDAARSGAFSPLPYMAIATGALAVLAAAIAGALVTTYVQTQAVTFTFPTFKFEKLAPAAGFKRMFSRDAAVGGCKAVLVAGSVSGALYPLVCDAFGVGVAAAAPSALAALVVHALQTTLFCALAVALPFAAGDVLLERAKWKRRLRMSFDEMRRDHKATEGDPQLRGRRRRTHRELVRGSIARLKEAAFVVTNPEHIAIALEYRPPDVAVPRVLVRAVDAGAREVKRRARELRVPIVEDVPLARALLATTGVGEYIPPDAYGAMAAVVAALLRENVLAS